MSARQSPLLDLRRVAFKCNVPIPQISPPSGVRITEKLVRSVAGSLVDSGYWVHWRALSFLERLSLPHAGRPTSRKTHPSRSSRKVACHQPMSTRLTKSKDFPPQPTAPRPRPLTLATLPAPKT